MVNGFVGSDAADYFRPMLEDLPLVHPMAVVTEAKLGLRTKVWQFASIIRGAVIGDDCNIASCVIVDSAVMGDRCLIGHGSSLHPGTLLADDVFVGPAVTFCNDRWPRVPKDGFDIDWLLSGGASIIVRDEASVGAGVVVLPGVVIGTGAMIAAGAVVDRDVMDYHLFKRSGDMVPVDPAMMMPRVRPAAV